MTETVILEVQTRAQMNDFLLLPERLYRGDAAWVSRPLLELKSHLSSSNPYYKTAQVWLYVAYDKQKRAIGRISVQVVKDQETAETKAKVGHFGFLEAEDETVLKFLLSHAEGVLKDHGCHKIEGPYSLSINDESGLLVDGFDKSPRLMMNYAQDWYGKALEEKASYQPAMDLLAYDVSVSEDLPKAAKFMAQQARRDPRVSVRSINMKAFKDDLGVIVDIFNDAWAENWGFVPMTKDDVAYMAKSMKPIIDPDMALLASVDGRPAAMIVALPDANEALARLNGRLLPFGWAKILWRLKVKGVRTARVLLMGVKREHHNTPLSGGLSALLIEMLHTRAAHKNLKAVEMSWILETNKPIRRLIEMVGGTVSRRYRLYGKNLSL